MVFSVENSLVSSHILILVLYLETVLTYTVQLKFNFTLARKDTRAFASFLRGITEYFLSI